MSSSGQMSQQLQDYLRETDAALRANDTLRALRIADEATERGFVHPNLMAMAAHRRMNDGDDEGALALLTRASVIGGGNADVLNAYGMCLVKLGRAREALAAFDAALAIVPGAALLRFNKGLAHEKLGELDHARVELEAVVAADPVHHEALSKLATWAAGRNDATAARGYADRALALKPGTAAAMLALAAADMAEKNFALAAGGLRRLLADPALSPVNRALGYGMLGDVLDAQDLPREAFPAYEAANATLREFYAPDYRSDARESAAARVRRLTDYFRDADAGPWRADLRADAADKPVTHVFLVGFPRSGTTLLEQVLASHPDMEAMEERDALVDAIGDFIEPPGGLDRLARLRPDQLEDYRRAYWRRCAEFGHRGDRRVFIDKMPLYSALLPLVARLFPRARILFALRDPRDVVFSCFRRRFGMTTQMYEFTSLDTAAAYYGAVMGLSEIYRDRLGLTLTETRHENLLGDFEGETRRLCEFLGLAWRPEMKDFAARARASNINTPSGAQVARGLSRDGVGQWRRYEGELGPVLPLLAPWVTRFGYDKE